MFPHNARLPEIFKNANLDQFPVMKLGDTLKPNAIYIFGPNGVGKSHLAAAIVNRNWVGRSELWIDPKALLAALRGAQHPGAEHSQEWILSEITDHPGWVVLDDLLSATKTDFGLSAVLHVLDGRISNRHPVIVTGDKAVEEIKGLDSSIASRLGGLYPIRLQGPDRRFRGKMTIVDTEKGLEEEVDL